MPVDDNALPAWFNDRQQRIRHSYLTPGNTIYQQSGWGSTPERWRAGREVILNGVPRAGDFLDIGCANGLLLENLIAWSAERGIALTPHGIDFVPELVELARVRLAEHAANFAVANAFDW